MILLIDAIGTLISRSDSDDFETRTLNKELADYLATRDTLIVVVTNAWWDNYKKIRELLAGYSFETFTLENRTTKEDPAYFEHLLQYYGLDPENCYYLDHKKENLASAAQCSIQWELFVENEQAIELLKTL